MKQNTYKLWVNKKSAIDRKILKHYIISEDENEHDDFNSIDTSNKLIPKVLKFIDVVNLFNNGVEIIFVNRDDAGKLYMEVAKQIKIQKTIDPLLRHEPLYNALFNLADMLFEKYNTRIKMYIFEQEYHVPYDKYNFTGLKLEDITLNKITRKG